MARTGALCRDFVPAATAACAHWQHSSYRTDALERGDACRRSRHVCLVAPVLDVAGKTLVGVSSDACDHGGRLHGMDTSSDDSVVTRAAAGIAGDSACDPDHRRAMGVRLFPTSPRRGARSAAHFRSNLSSACCLVGVRPGLVGATCRCARSPSVAVWDVQLTSACSRRSETLARLKRGVMR